jgi:hypothetical protein
MSVEKNLSKRAHVILPVELVADIDALVGKRGRSAFLTQIARDEIQRRQEALRQATGAWKDEDHPELAQGAAAWVRASRTESETRFQQIEKGRNRD